MLEKSNYYLKKKGSKNVSEKPVMSSRIFKVGLGVILIVLLVIGGYYFLSKTKSNEASGEANQEDNQEDSQDQDKKTIIPRQLGHVNAERDRLKVSFGPAYYIPTGLYVKEKQKITVTLSEHDQVNQPHVIISPPVLYGHEEAIKEGTRLKEGEREITATDEGILYLVNNSYESDTPPEVTIEGAHILPTFELGKTTEEEWHALLEEHADAPAFELVSDKVTITAGMDHKDLVTDPEGLLKKHEEIVDIQAQASGLYEDDPDPVHQPTKFPYHFRHSDEDGVWMYAFLNHTAYHTQTLADLLDVDQLTENGWGPWHELGHVHQQPATTPGIFTEVTNNIFSMTVQKEFDRPSRLEEDGIYERAFAYLEGERSAEAFAELDDFELLVLPWQLQLTFGEELYPNLYRLVRETDGEELPATDEEKLQKWMLWTSTLTEFNLLPMYERWGWDVEEETREEIEALGHPEMTAPIWWNRDSNNTIKAFDVTVASVLETLEAYEEELDEEVFTLLEEKVTEAESDEEKLEDLITLLDEQKEAEEISEKMHEILTSQVLLVE